MGASHTVKLAIHGYRGFHTPRKAPPISQRFIDNKYKQRLGASIVGGDDQLLLLQW